MILFFSLYLSWVLNVVFSFYIVIGRTNGVAPRARERNPIPKKFGNLSIREILVTTWPYARPPVHLSVCTTGKPMWNDKFCIQCKSLKPDNRHPYCGELIGVKTGHLLTSVAWTIIGSGANSSRSRVWTFSADQLLPFNWSRAQVYVFQLWFSAKLSIERFY